MSGMLTNELLVILADDVLEREELGRCHMILHSISPRMAVIRKPTNPSNVLLRAVLCTDGEVPSAILATLPPQEQQWANAWNLRKQPKQRKGDGASWDAPEFLPPDDPAAG